MRSSSHFPRFLCFVFLLVSSATSQHKSEWNSKKIKNEFLKVNDRISLLSEEIASLKEQNSEWNSQSVQTELRKLNEKYSDLSHQIHEFKGQSEMKRRVGALEKSVSLTAPHVHLRSSDEYYKTEPDFTWTINDIRNKTKESNFTLLSEVFPLKGYSFGAQAKLNLTENGYLLIRLSYKDLSENGTALNLTLVPKVHYTYKEGTTQNIMREDTYLFTSVMQYDVFCYNQWIISANFIANDDVYIDIHVEQPESILQGYSYNGILTWAIDHFRSKREAESRDVVWRQRSPYFYTGPKGYRVQAKAWLDGVREYDGKGLTIEIDFLTGPYDADLTRSFKHTTTLTLFHPTDPAKVIVKSVDRDLKDGAWYTIDMGTHAEIYHLLYEDTLYFHVRIIPA